MSESPRVIYCPECKYYYAPVCTFYKWLPMVSRKGYCYHAVKGKYEGATPIVQSEKADWFAKFMNLPEEDIDGQ